MTDVRLLLNAAIVVFGIVSIVLLINTRLDTLDKLASVGSFALAAGLALVAWRQRPRVHKPVSKLLPSRSRRDYLRWVIARNRDMDIRGLGTQGPFSLGVENVFVDVSLVPRPVHQASGDPFARIDDESNERRSVWSFLTEWPSRTLVIVGPPGSGKTTLLKHLALALASGLTQAGRPVRNRVPVLLVIRDHVQDIAADAELPLIRPVLSALPTELHSCEAWLVKQLSRGNCLVLLDGLDEVADPEQRRLVSTWVERQIAAHHTNGFILTSRPYGYQANPLNSADVLQVRPFSHNQIEKFLRRWYLATEIRRAGRKDGVVTSDAQMQAGDLLQRLQGNPHLYDLAVNPLLLTMIAHVHNYRGVLPGSRAELYREICQVFLGGRQLAKGLTSDLTADQRESVLKHLSLHMMEGRMRDIDATSAARTIRAQLARVAPGVKPENFMIETEQQSGLLLQRESGVFAFAHLTFQEYLAAVRLRERGTLTDLIARTDDQWWREVTLLYCADADAGPIVEACIRADTARSLLLASDCTEVARELDPEIRMRLEQVLSAEAQSKDPSRAQLIGQVLLAHKLRRVQHHDVDVVLVDHAITNAEFALFLRDEETHGRGRRPAHWATDLIENIPHEPVTGVSDSDVRAFCAWLSSADGWTYERHPGPDAHRRSEARSGISPIRAVRDEPLRIKAHWAKRQQFREAKLEYLHNTEAIHNQLFRSEVANWLSNKLRAVSEENMAEDVRRLDRDLSQVQLRPEGADCIAAVRIDWHLWHTAPERSADMLMPLVVNLTMLAESVWTTHYSLAPRVAELLDHIIILHWQSSGLVPAGPELWLRRN